MLQTSTGLIETSSGLHLIRVGTRTTDFTKKMKRILFFLVICFTLSAISVAETEVEVSKEGSCRGKEQARDGAKVTVDYDGYLQDRRGNAGKKFTSTYSLTDPYSFTIGANEVISGLEQVIYGNIYV